VLCCSSIVLGSSIDRVNEVLGVTESDSVGPIRYPRPVVRRLDMSMMDQERPTQGKRLPRPKRPTKPRDTTGMGANGKAYWNCYDTCQKAKVQPGDPFRACVSRCEATHQRAPKMNKAVTRAKAAKKSIPKAPKNSIPKESTNYVVMCHSLCRYHTPPAARKAEFEACTKKYHVFDVRLLVPVPPGVPPY